MNPTRRAFLAGGVSLAALIAARTGGLGAAPSWSRPALVLVTGVDRGTHPIRLATLFEPFVLRGIPIAISLAAGSADADDAAEESAIARLLNDAIADHGGLLEIAADIGDVASTDPYFQLRQASDAQNAFVKLINPPRTPVGALLTGLTATTTTPLKSYQDFAAVRAAGFRTVIHLDNDGDTGGVQAPGGGYWITDNGVANVFGAAVAAKTERGRDKSAPSFATGIEQMLQAAAGAEEPLILKIPLEMLGELDEPSLAAEATRLALSVRKAVEDGRIRTVLPSTLFAQTRPDAQRNVGLRIDGAADDDETRRYVEQLLGRGLSVTFAVEPGAMKPLAAQDPKLDIAGLVAGDGAPDPAAWARKINAATKIAGRPIETLAAADASDGATVSLMAASAGLQVFSGAEPGFGIDRHGVLHAPGTVEIAESDASAKDVLNRIGATNDVVLVIKDRDIRSPARRRMIDEVVTALSNDASVGLGSIRSFTDATSVKMPLLDQIRYARSEVRLVDARPGDIGARERDQLVADAALAWQFFDWGATQYKGMVPGTAWYEFGKRAGYPFATQWDFGSYVQAAVAAHRLKLIDQNKFESTVATILKFLGQSSFPYKGVKLPDVERGVAKEKPKGRGFDSADTGRLLIALRCLENYAPGAFATKKLVRSWGLKSIIIDGVLHSVSGSKLFAVPHNSYSHYARQGYAAWSFDVAPIHEEEELDMDGSMRLLNLVASRGRIATEPTVTEEIEVGGTDHTRLVADVLYGAQIKRYRDTGILTCVSEGPIDGPPYFTYTGYQITPEGGDFVVDGRNLEQKEQLDRLGDKWRMVSSKACFLWYAARPGAYSDKLIELVRSAGRIEGLGFASGIHETTGKATALTDVNTNGLILESIAYILGGRVPLIAQPHEMRTAKGD